MPTWTREDGAPVILFDPTLEISPFTLFKRLQRDGAPLLVDIRSGAHATSLRGAISGSAPEWCPPDEQTEVVLFDDDGTAALSKAKALREAGYGRVKVLFGGLDLYEFSLDPRVVGQETFLEVTDS
ncbi:MAG: hypothetical protein OEM62_10700 [Acidobacteriota bacterium]|nr:hypothetical protein [Acidobacteriota bacterium]